MIFLLAAFSPLNEHHEVFYDKGEECPNQEDNEIETVHRRLLSVAGVKMEIARALLRPVPDEKPETTRGGARHLFLLL